jgi:hypothetical protein
MGASGSSKLRRALRRLPGRLWQWQREKPLLLLIPLALLPFLLEQLTPTFIDMIAARLGLSKPGTILVFLALLGAAALLSFIAHLVKGTDDPLESFDTDYERITRLDDKGVDRVQAELIKPLFEEAHPNEEEIRKMYRKNPVMGVAIRSRKEDEVVAFACAWPLTARALARLTDGRISENDLTADDILATSRNRRATHLLVPVVAVRDPGTKEGIKQNWALRAAFQDLVCEVYYDRDARPITFVATGFSPAGRRICAQLGMARIGEAEMGGEKLPIFSRTMTRQEFKQVF